MAFDVTSAVPIEPASTTTFSRRRFDIRSATPVNLETYPQQLGGELQQKGAAENQATIRTATGFVPTLMAMGAEAAVPELGLPHIAGMGLKALASGVGGAIGRWMQGGLLQEPTSPQELARTGAEYTAFPMLLHATEPVGQLSERIPGLRQAIGAARQIPGLRTAFQPGTVLNTAVRVGTAGSLLGGAETLLPDEQTEPIHGTPPTVAKLGLHGVGDYLQHRLPMASQEAVRNFPGQAMAGGVFQAIAPKRLGGGNFFDAVSGRAKVRADQEIARLAESLKQSAQRGGSAQPAIQAALKRQADFAFEPARTLASAIREPIRESRLLDIINEHLASDPERAARAKSALTGWIDAIRPVSRISIAGQDVPVESFPMELRQQVGAGGDRSMSAQQLVDASSQLGKRVPVGVKRRVMPAQTSHLPALDARGAIVDALTEAAPSHLQGAMQDFKARWSDYANGFRNPIYRYLQPGSSPETPISPSDAGMSFFTRVAKGDITSSERSFVQRLEQETGMQILQPLQALGRAAATAQGQQRLASRAANLAARVAIWGPVGALTYLAIRRPIYQSMRRR